MTTSRNNNQNQQIFLEAMKDVSPIKPRNYVIHEKPVKKNTHYKAVEIASFPTRHALSDGLDNVSSPSEYLLFTGKGLQHSLLKKFKSGKIAIDDTLDLHGATIDEARSLTIQFLEHGFQANYRCLIIIHGKGHLTSAPKIKPQVAHWLKQIPFVLAYCSAKPEHGGTGAIYVLLKQRHKTPNK